MTLIDVFNQYFGGDSSVRLQVLARIRSVSSWEELTCMMTDYGYTLFPAEDDVFAINLSNRDTIFLGDSGHLFPFIVERLGDPPEELKPFGFYRMQERQRYERQAKIQDTSRMYG